MKMRQEMYIGRLLGRNVVKFGWCMVFNTTFNNISVISWRKHEYPEKTMDINR